MFLQPGVMPLHDKATCIFWKKKGVNDLNKKQILMRLLQIIVVLFGISFITFGLTYMSPGDPVRNMYSANGVMPTEEMVEQTREEMGLNDPFFVQYGRWLGNCLQGDLYLRIADRYTGIRRIEVCANRVAPESYVQYSLFDDPKQTDKERHLQEAVLNVKQRYGKNAIMRGSNLLECSTYRERNEQIGGHRA